MTNPEPFESSSLGRRIRLSTLEITLSMMLTVAAIAAVIASGSRGEQEEAGLARLPDGSAPRR